MATSCTLTRSAKSNCNAGAVDNPEDWRARAEKSRTLAEQMNDGEIRRIGIADSYEHLAERAVERAKWNIFSSWE
jgi:hypothetical protein